MIFIIKSKIYLKIWDNELKGGIDYLKIKI